MEQFYFIYTEWWVPATGGSGGSRYNSNIAEAFKQEHEQARDYEIWTMWRPMRVAGFVSYSAQM